MRCPTLDYYDRIGASEWEDLLFGFDEGEDEYYELLDGNPEEYDE